MPKLKWGRIDVRDIGGRGLNSDVDGPDGSPIMFIQNGFIGVDQRPYPRIITFNGSGGGIFFIAALRMGEGGTLSVDGSDQADTNGNTGRMRWVINSLASTRNYQVFRGMAGLLAYSTFTATMAGAAQPVPGSAGLNIVRRRTTLFNNPLHGSVATPPFIIAAAGPNIANPSITNGIAAHDAAVVAVVAGSAQQPGGPTCDNAGGNCGEFILYQSAARWFLTKVVKNDPTGAVIPNVLNSVDPSPTTAFNTVTVDRFQVWGSIDTVTAATSMLPVHATGSTGVYMASQCAEFFQGRVVCGNVILAPKYTVAGDLDLTKYVQKANRLIWTILPGESPTRGPFAGASEGLTHLQHPWNIEVNNYIDVDGVGQIYQIVNLGDNQLFIIGQDGCARLTGYLTTAVSGVNSASFDVRPIMRSPGGSGPGCAVLTANGVYYTDGNTIYHYDGNTITDVLAGAAKGLFDGFMIWAGYSPNDGGPGLIDDQHIYFSVFGSFASGNINAMLVLNIYTGKWSYHTPAGGAIVFQSTYKGAFNYRDAAGQSRIVLPANNITSPYTAFNTGGSGRTAINGVDASQQTRQYAYRSQLTGTEPYAIALRPFGQPGIPKRFRHLVVNYGLDSPNSSLAQQYTLVIRAVYGWDGGWPDSFTNAPVIATLPATNAAQNGVLQLGAIPTKSVRIALDDTSLRNFYGNGITTMGWPDTVVLYLQVTSNGSTGGFLCKINSIDVSWMELAIGDQVMA